MRLEEGRGDYDDDGVFIGGGCGGDEHDRDRLAHRRGRVISHRISVLCVQYHVIFPQRSVGCLYLGGNR